jgi:arylformamidase
MTSSIIDITPDLHPGISVWDGDTPFQYKKNLDMEKGDPWDSGSIQMSLHTGVHADAPAHFIPEREGISEVPLENYLGPALVFSQIGKGKISVEDLKPAMQQNPERLLIKTCPGRNFDLIPQEYSFFDESAANLIVKAGLKLIGIDTPSVDNPTAKILKIHRILGNANVSILENLKLTKVNDGFYELIALPLKIVGGDASPVRAVLRAVNG